MSKVNEGMLKQPAFHVKDPGSALTHFIAMVLAVVFTPPLLIHAANRNIGMGGMTSLAVFMESMVLLFAASSAYHTFNLTEKGNRLLKKLDHMMIFILIAGTYTPVCVIHLWGHGGGWLMAAVWGLAAVGMLFKLFWVGCPKWVSSVIYIGMGWTCVFAWPQIVAYVPQICFWWLLAGGIVYTAGGIIYALKLKFLDNRFPDFGTHELFHLFVMGGSVCQYLSLYCSL